MVLGDEKCGDLIEVELPRYGKVLGYLQSINVDLTKPKNIATVEVFVWNMEALNMVSASMDMVM